MSRKISHKETIKTTQKYLRSLNDPEMRIIANNLEKGFRLFLLSLKVIEATEKVKLPKGVRVSHVDFENTTKAAQGVMLACAWVQKAVEEGAKNAQA